MKTYRLIALAEAVLYSSGSTRVLVGAKRSGLTGPDAARHSGKQ